MEIVNGYVCKNCTDVDNAKKHIDPARPKDGPNGKDAPEKRAAERSEKVEQERGPAVTFAGALAQAQQAQQPNGVERVRPTAYVPGSSVTLKV